MTVETGLSPDPRRALGAAPTWLALAAVVLLYVAERILGVDESGLRDGVLAGAGIAWAVALVLRFMALKEAQGGARRFVLVTAACQLVAGAGAIAYFGWLDLAEAKDEAAPAVLVLALFLMVGSSAVLAALQWAAGPMKAAGHIEIPRLAFAGMTAGVFVSAVGALAGFNYAAEKGDLRKDFSFAAPTSPSEATRSLLAASPSPVEVFLFFERGSPVLNEVGDYFEGLEQAGAKVERLDYALDPELSGTLKVSKNGTVALRSGERSETWFVGTERDQAQRKLKKVDEEIRTRLAKITRDEKIVYFTVGHGERDERKSAQGEASGAKVLMSLAQSLNVKTQKLGIAEGLASDVPADAAAVLILGPRNSFLDAEVEALSAYVKRGGSVFVAIDPGADHNLGKLLELLGVRADDVEVCNDQEFVRQSHTQADHAFVFSSSFTSHKATKTLSGARGKAVLLFLGAGALTATDEKAPGRKVTMIVRSRAGSFEDSVRNRVFDEGKETRKVLDLAAAVEMGAEDGEGQARAVIVGDSEVVSDTLMQNEANQVFGYEALMWLMKDDAAAGALDNEQDVPILHSRSEDAAWFYGTTFLGPVLVLGGGLLVVRTRRRRRTA